MTLSLPLPGGGALDMPVTLSLVEALEAKGGSVFQIADRLVAHDIGLGEIVTLVKTCYAAAGHDLAAADFLLMHRPAEILTDILSAIIAPLTDMGAVAAGKE